MKRAQKVQQGLVACCGTCQEAAELRAQVDEAAEVMDRHNREWQELIRNRDHLVRLVRELRQRVRALDARRIELETRGAVY